MTQHSPDTINVLVADDEVEFASTLVARLNLRKFKATMVNSGQDTLEELARSRPDVLLLDLKMPDLDGLEVLARLREDHPHLTVIILTGHGAFEAGKKGMELGAWDYLMKPVDLSMLIDKIIEAHTASSAGSE